MAFKSAMLQIVSGDKRHAVACASEFPSRLFKSTRFEAQSGSRKRASASIPNSCAGCCRTAPEPRYLKIPLALPGCACASNGSNCFRLPISSNLACMLARQRMDTTWSRGSIIRVMTSRQRRRNQSAAGYSHARRCCPSRRPGTSAELRKRRASIQMTSIGLPFIILLTSFATNPTTWPLGSASIYRDERWFTNLSSTGNVGSASTFLLLEELLYSGKLKTGDNILCLVPESGRFLFGYMLLKVVAKATSAALLQNRQLKSSFIRTAATGQRQAIRWPKSSCESWPWSGLNLKIASQRVPIVKKLYDGRFTLEDYRALLFNLRQQVIDGSRWIGQGRLEHHARTFPHSQRIHHAHQRRTPRL